MFNTISPKVYKRIRERKGLSQTELGDDLGVRRFTISNYEKGNSKPSAELEEILLEVCDCSEMEFSDPVAPTALLDVAVDGLEVLPRPGASSRGT